jgi:hypothetical protein
MRAPFGRDHRQVAGEARRLLSVTSGDASTMPKKGETHMATNQASRSRTLCRLGGIAASVVVAVHGVRLSPAANGELVTVGGSFFGTVPTVIENTTGGDTGTSAIVGASNGPYASGVLGHAKNNSGSINYGAGVYGFAGDGPPPPPTSNVGVYGRGGHGVFGESDSGSGLVGVSRTGLGVEGQTDGNDQAAIRGFARQLSPAAGGAGVLGYSGSIGGLPATPTGTGVAGIAESGTGVLAKATAPEGTALDVQGRVRFSSSGRGTIAALTRGAVVAPGMDLTATTKIHVTLASDPGRRVLRYVGIDPVADTFNVELTGMARTDVAFVWFITE